LLQGRGFSAGDLVGFFDDAGVELDGGFDGVFLHGLQAAGEVEQRLTRPGVEGEERAEPGELGRPAAVFEGVQVSLGRAGAGAFSTSWHLPPPPLLLATRR
jgi:hypothetical protein